MDLNKIGKFIACCRKEKNLTQEQLAEKLNITDRAISKWERGLSLPDASIMLELCNILDINVNELLCGEMIDKKDYDKKSEELLLEMAKEKEESDKRMLRLEIIIVLTSTIVLSTLIIIASFIEMQDYIRVLLIVSGLITFIIGMHNAIIIEQTAGYYECQRCHYKYIPTYSSVFFSMHMNRTRYMKCPKCNKKSWQKKVLSK